MKIQKNISKIKSGNISGPIDAVFAFLTIFIFLLRNEIDNLQIIGIILISLSVHMVYKCKCNRFLLYMIVIICMVNLSIGINDFIKMGKDIAEWQTERMRMTEYNYITAKSLLLFNTTLNLCLRDDILNQNSEIEKIYNYRNSRDIISAVYLVLLFAILIYAIFHELQLHKDGYTSVRNPIYEYSSFIFVLAWFECRKNKILNTGLMIYAAVFTVVFLSIGDRSSVVEYLIFVLITQYKGKVTFGRAILAAFSGIIFFNMIAVYRNYGFQRFDIFWSRLLGHGLYSDTASYAYYSSITVLAAGMEYNHPLEMLIGFALSVLGFDSQFEMLPVFAKSLRGYLYFNTGGCIFPTYFMVWMGYFGSALAGLIIGGLIRKLFSDVQGINLYFRFLMIMMTVRWYVYTPTCLFRSVFYIGTLVYIIHSLFVRIMQSQYLLIVKLNSRKV